MVTYWSLMVTYWAETNLVLFSSYFELYRPTLVALTVNALRIGHNFAFKRILSSSPFVSLKIRLPRPDSPFSQAALPAVDSIVPYSTSIWCPSSANNRQSVIAFAHSLPRRLYRSSARELHNEPPTARVIDIANYSSWRQTQQDNVYKYQM